MVFSFSQLSLYLDKTKTLIILIFKNFIQWKEY